MERDIFPRDEVFSRLKDQFVLVSQYTDDQNDPAPALNLVKYSGAMVQVPKYFVLAPDGSVLGKLDPPTNIANLSAEEFARFLDDAKAKFSAGS